MPLRIKSKLIYFIFATGLIHAKALAQNEGYQGSIADGNALGMLSSFTPAHSITMHTPYNGANGDGHSCAYLINYEPAATPPLIFSPYHGTIGDGFAGDSLFFFNSSNPPLVFNPYYGGTADGWTNQIHYTTYTFIGNGNWEDSANWYKNAVPPSILAPGEAILINPPYEGICILHSAQTISTGARLIVKPGRTLLVKGDLIQQ